MENTINKPLYYTAEDVFNIIYGGKSGKPVISKPTFMKMLQNGIIPGEKAGDSKRSKWLIPAYWVEEKINSLKNTKD